MMPGGLDSAFGWALYADCTASFPILLYTCSFFCRTSLPTCSFALFYVPSIYIERFRTFQFIIARLLINCFKKFMPNFSFPRSSPSLPSSLPSTATLSLCLSLFLSSLCSLLYLSPQHALVLVFALAACVYLTVTVCLRGASMQLNAYAGSWSQSVSPSYYAVTSTIFLSRL